MRWYGCPIRYSGGLIGDKWCLLLIRDLLFKGRRYYSDFLDDDEAIASNILADRLSRLVSAGIVEKTRDVNNGKKFVYTLTAKGKDLLPVMMEMFKWAHKHDENTFVSKDYIEDMHKAPKQYSRKILKDIKQADEAVLRYRGDD